MNQFGWLSERGRNFLNLLQKEGGTQKGGGFPQKRGGGGSNPGGNYACVKGYLQAFFTFSPNFNFWGQCWFKVQKVAQGDKKLLHSLSLEAYII